VGQEAAKPKCGVGMELQPSLLRLTDWSGGLRSIKKRIVESVGMRMCITYPPQLQHIDAGAEAHRRFKRSEGLGHKHLTKGAAVRRVRDYIKTKWVI